MRKQENSFETGKSPKIRRRSMSPVEFINTPEYRERARNKEVRLNFGYIGQKKLDKVNLRRLESKNVKPVCQSLTALLIDGETEDSNFLGIKLIKDRNIAKMYDETNDTDFFKCFEEQCDLLKSQAHLHTQLDQARTKIRLLEQQLQRKTKLNEEQSKIIAQQQSMYQLVLMREKQTRCQLDKLLIKMQMEDRQKQEHLNSIKKLRAAEFSRGAGRKSTKVQHQPVSRQDENLLCFSPEKQDR